MLLPLKLSFLDRLLRPIHFTCILYNKNKPLATSKGLFVEFKNRVWKLPDGGEPNTYLWFTIYIINAETEDVTA